MGGSVLRPNALTEVGLMVGTGGKANTFAVDGPFVF